MTNDPSKRRIEITDKRLRGEQPGDGQGETAEPGMAVPTPEAEAPPEAVDWQAKAMEYLDLAQRKEAELRNFARRVQQEKDDARRFAVEELLADLFPALDGLAQCARTYRDQPDGADPLLDGVRRTVRVLESALSKHGVEKISEAGVPFDPQHHNALSVEESPEATAETVAEVYVEGYRMGNVVLKPAMVRVVRPA
jgi:molecular chaperone GrpE